MKALVVAASIMFFVLVLGVAGLASFPDPDAGEPVVELDVAVPEGAALAPAGSEGQAAPAPPSSAQAPSPAEAGANGDVGLPPGFAVDGSSPVPPLPESLPQSAPGASPSTPMQQASVDAPTAAIAASAGGDAGDARNARRRGEGRCAGRAIAIRSIAQSRRRRKAPVGGLCWRNRVMPARQLPESPHASLYSSKALVCRTA